MPRATPQTPAAKIRRDAVFWKGCTRFPRLTEREKTTAAAIHIDHGRAKAAMRAAVDALCTGEPRSFRNPGRLGEAGDFIFSEFERLGCRVARQPFDAAGRSWFNVIAEPPADPAKPLVIIGAHYDVCGNTPGADDNASSIAAMLSLAENWEPHAGRAGVRLQFAAYSLEEPPFFNTPLMGSRVHAQSLPPGDPPAFMLSLDCLGYYNDGKRSQKYPVGLARVSYPSVGNFLFAITNPRGKKNAKAFYSLARGHSNLRVEYIALPSAAVNFSDHYSYWRHNIPAFVLTDTAWFRNPHYHQLGDTPGTLDYARLAETVQLLARYLATRQPAR